MLTRDHFKGQLELGITHKRVKESDFPKFYALIDVSEKREYYLPKIIEIYEKDFALYDFITMSCTWEIGIPIIRKVDKSYKEYLLNIKQNHIDNPRFTKYSTLWNYDTNKK